MSMCKRKKKFRLLISNNRKSPNPAAEPVFYGIHINFCDSLLLVLNLYTVLKRLNITLILFNLFNYYHIFTEQKVSLEGQFWWSQSKITGGWR